MFPSKPRRQEMKNVKLNILENSKLDFIAKVKIGTCHLHYTNGRKIWRALFQKPSTRTKLSVDIDGNRLHYKLLKALTNIHQIMNKTLPTTERYLKIMADAYTVRMENTERDNNYKILKDN